MDSRWRRVWGILLLLSCLAVGLASLGSAAVTAIPVLSPQYHVRTFVQGGQSIDQVIVPGRPPKGVHMPAIDLRNAKAVGIVTLNNVPAFDWSYGCSATSASMMMGYYDNGAFTNMYVGPTNGGVCPQTNAVWGVGECPLSATHLGYDNLSIRGHVDDYWIEYLNAGPDPYVVNGWTEHTLGNCTGDYMGTNQAKYGNVDGSTTFYFYTNGAPLEDYTGSEPSARDGCHGIRLFVQSRGYTVTNNFSQYIYGYNGNTLGFTFAQYMAEIDAGRPVLIQVEGHTMIGMGYNTTGNIVYLHDTWDYSTHEMTWGGAYAGMQQYGVTVLRMPTTNNPPTADDKNVSTNEDTALPITLTGSDPDGDTLGFSINTQPANGTLTGTESNVTYTPKANYAGADSFTFRVSDGKGGSDTGTVSITVNAVNDSPVANDDTASTTAGTAVIIAVLTNDTDVDGDMLTASAVSDPPNGTTVINANNTVTYTPDAGFTGSDSFTYTASDGKGGSDTATVSVTVSGGGSNTAPVAVADSYTVCKNTPFTVGCPGLCCNDHDAEGDALTTQVVSLPRRGTIVLQADGSFTYTPKSQYNGSDSFTYRVYDGKAYSAPATVKISIKNALPMLVDICPGVFPNTITLGKTGQLPVAILGTATLSVTTINFKKTRLAGASVCYGVYPEYRDINGDGRLDMIIQLMNERVRLTPQDVLAYLESYTNSGQYLMGVDSVVIQP